MTKPALKVLPRETYLTDEISKKLPINCNGGRFSDKVIPILPEFSDYILKDD